MPINTGIALVGVAIQDDAKTPSSRPSFVHGLTGGSPFAFERTVETISVACGYRGNISAHVAEINVNPSVSSLGYQEVVPVYAYGALGAIESEPLGKGLYKHTITVGESLPSLTIFGQEGQADAKGFGKTVSCKVNELEFSFSDTDPLTMTPNLMGCNLIRLRSNPNAGFTPLCYEGYFTPVGGEFRLDTAGHRPMPAVITEGTWTISNDCEAVRDPTTHRPAYIQEKISKASVSLNTVPEDFEDFWRMVTGSSNANEPASHIVYGSYYAKFMHSENPDFTMTIEGNKVPFTAEVPEVDPEGGTGTFTFSSEDSYVEKVGDSPIVITVINDIADYFDPRTYALPANVPDPVLYGEVADGVDAEEMGKFHISGRSKFITGTAKRISGREGLEDGYWLPLMLDDWEGASVSTTARGASIPFKDKLALVPLGDEEIEVSTLTVTDAGSEATTYQVEVEIAEDLPPVTLTIDTDDQPYGKDTSEFGTFDVSNRSRTITGTANRIESYEGFTNPDRREGYYLAVVCDPWEGTETRVRRGGQWSETWSKCVNNGVVVAWLGKDSIDVDAMEVKAPDGTVTEYAVDVKAAPSPILLRAGKAVAKVSKASAKSAKAA